MRLFALLLAPVLAEPAEVDRLGFIAGCWEAKFGPVVIQETWNAPLGGIMQGVGRTVKDGKAVFHEFMRIEEKGGTPVYVARIGVSNTPFKAIKVSESEVVFENPTHDFPQRIIYRKTADGLFARIEGIDKGKEKHQDFPMKRVACP